MITIPKLYSFGCSLTANGWPEKLSKHIGFHCVNVAVGAGDNLTQIRRFKDLFLNNSISKNDYVIWEITYLDRLGFRLSSDHHFYLRNKDNNAINFNFHKFNKNMLDDSYHIDYVSFNKEWYETNWYVKNVNQMLTELLFALILANQLTEGKLLIWFAQNNIFESYKIEEKFISCLDKNKIEHLDYKKESLMSWVYDNNYSLASDKMHPTDNVYELYYETFILPRIKNKLDK